MERTAFNHCQFSRCLGVVGEVATLDFRLLLAFLVLIFAISPQGSAADPVGDLIKRECIDCHDAEVARGGLRLDLLKPVEQEPSTLAIWMKIRNRVADGEMPPKKKIRDSEAEKFLNTLEKQLNSADMKRRKTDGRVPLRRLNRVEYEHTIEDLLAINDMELREILPPDQGDTGFDNAVDAQDISYVQIGRYLEAADHALSAAMALRERPERKVHRQVLKDSKYFNYVKDGKFVPGGRGDARHVDEWVVFTRQKNNEQGQWILDNDFNEPGFYRFRIRCRGVEIDSAGSGNPKDNRLSPPTVRHVAALQIQEGRFLNFFDVPDQAEVVEFTAWLHGNEVITFFCATLDDRDTGGESGALRRPYKGPGIAVDWIDMEGPLLEQWPPESHVRLFGNLPLERWNPGSGLRNPEPAMIGTGLKPQIWQGRGGQYVVASKDPARDSERLLRQFLERAFRRPVDSSEVLRYQELALAAMAEKYCFQEAMRIAYKAVLTSPDFLFMREFSGRLDGHALASRLSYFLWRSMPDDLLQAKARSGAILRAEELREETERMLNDPRSRRFIDDFTDQWLDIDQINETAPDRQLYPEYFCDHHLVDSLAQETRGYFSEMVRSDLGIRYVYAGDFAMINERLSQLYNIPGVKGSAIRRVQLPTGSPRGGFITQGSVLKVTANGVTTSPVKRGAWLIDRILGKPAPPPPADAGSIEPDTRGSVTIRDQLDKHRSISSCASCHKKIDPPGFALESFDVLGATRERYRSLERGDEVRLTVGVRNVRFLLGPAVDNGSSKGGPADGVVALRQVLQRDEAVIATNLIERLIAYSTGAPPTIADKPVVESILKESRPKKFGLRTLIHGIVQSEVFKNK